jgi:hypothetical protein
MKVTVLIIFKKPKNESLSKFLGNERHIIYFSQKNLGIMCNVSYTVKSKFYPFISDM